MTHLDFMDFFHKEIVPLWPKWEINNALDDLYSDTFRQYQVDDIKAAFRRHKMDKDYLEPKIPMVMKHLRTVIGERKAEERKQQPIKNLPCLAYGIVRMDKQGRDDRVMRFTSNRISEDTETMQRIFSHAAEADRVRCEQVYGGSARVVFGTDQDMADIEERIRVSMHEKQPEPIGVPW
jgi:hypothetical protein